MVTRNIAAVIPTLNEGQSIGKLVNFLYINGVTTYVIDDNSKDDTRAIASANGAYVIANKERVGITKSLWQGFNTVLGYNKSEYGFLNPYEYIVTIDAESHNPGQLFSMVQLAANYDMVIGSRFLPFSNYDNSNGTWYRPTASKLAAKLCNLAQSKAKFTDWTSGYRVYSMDLINSLSKFTYNSTMHPVQIELLARAHSIGANIKEYPIEYVAGKTSFNASVASEAFKIWTEVINHYPSRAKVEVKSSLW